MFFLQVWNSEIFKIQKCIFIIVLRENRKWKKSFHFSKLCMQLYERREKEMKSGFFHLLSTNWVPFLFCSTSFFLVCAFWWLVYTYCILCVALWTPPFNIYTSLPIKKRKKKTEFLSIFSLRLFYLSNSVVRTFLGFVQNILPYDHSWVCYILCWNWCNIMWFQLLHSIYSTCMFCGSSFHKFWCLEFYLEGAW